MTRTVEHAKAKYWGRTIARLLIGAAAINVGAWLLEIPLTKAFGYLMLTYAALQWYECEQDSAEKSK